jgi:hypothetical protein
LPGAAPSGLEGLGTFFLNMFGVLLHHFLLLGLPHQAALRLNAGLGAAGN